MSADLLRRAAALMRERAEAATDGPWSSRRGPGEHVVSSTESVATVTSLRPREDRRHIASWHPAVALAVADWLEHAAKRAAQIVPDVDELALAVARAYLGEAS